MLGINTQDTHPGAPPIMPLIRHMVSQNWVSHKYNAQVYTDTEMLVIVLKAINNLIMG